MSPTWHADLIIAAPKATQAVFAALGDYYTWKLGEKIYGHGSNEAWAAVCSFVSMNIISPTSKKVTNVRGVLHSSS